MPSHIAPPTPRIAELIRQVAERLMAETDLIEEMDAAIFEASPELAGDATIAAETRASSRANAQRWLGAMVLHPGEPISEDVPPEALDVARSMVRRGLELEALLHAYRRGQNVGWRRWMEHAAAAIPDKQELIEVLEVSSVLLFGYVDTVLSRLLEQVQREREELLGGGVARRMETVRLILDGAPLDQDRASGQLGYELGRSHTALVVWAEAPGAPQGALEQAATVLGRAGGAHRPLTVASGASALWAWLGTDAEPDPPRLREAMQGAAPGVFAAVGPTLPGMAGFRRSHSAALATQRLVAGNPSGERLTTYREVEVVTLAGQDQERMVEFVASTLGPLAGPEAASARLRETLRVYLAEGGHAPRTAQLLSAHRNTVLHRVARAEELLGHPVGEQRLALSLALELVHRLGPRALPRA